MEQTNKFVVVKFHDKEKYAAVVCGGSLSYCAEQIGFCKALYKELDYICFRVYKHSVYDECMNEDAHGGSPFYETIKNRESVSY